MNRRLISALAALAVTGTGAVVAIQGPSAATPGPSTAAAPAAKTVPTKTDNKPDALSTKRSALKERAATLVATGKKQAVTKDGSKVVNMGTASKPRWVEYQPTETAQLLTFLVDFGDGTGNPDFPDDAAGPVHNQIPEPDRSEDNSTYWEKDFSAEHYKEMFFTGLKDQDGESFHNVYKEMSSGRFDLQGDVSDWVTVPHPEAYYQTKVTDDDGNVTGEESATAMRNYIQDSANAWYDAQVKAGKTKAEIVDYLKSFDQWDRYDLDGDGNYNEPDGYIDHFQAIHAGTGEEAGAPTWTIWSHRWAANPTGTQGPDGYPHAGGVQIGDTGLWIRDYTTEPENGGLGVFSHEFGHDLGLPDFYDTNGGDNNTGFWTLMSSGSWMNHGKDTIGTTPNQMGPSEKLFLGWLNYATVSPGESKQLTLGPSYHDTGTSTPQAVVANLPDGKATNDVGSGSSGKTFLYSTSADNLTATAASPAVTVADADQLTAKVKYDLEKEYDYTFVEVSTDGSTWTAIPTNLSNGADLNYGIDGSSDASCSPNCATGKQPQTYADLTADLSAYAGQKVQVRFRTTTDGGTHYYGFAADDVKIGSSYSTGFDDAADWTLSKYLHITDGTYTVSYPRLYLAENRQYLGYDKTLAEGPYNFGWGVSAPDKVEHYPYQNGLLVWYENGLFSDNNTSTHAGGGQSLPVDAHPKALAFSNGAQPNSRAQAFDSTFGLEKTDPISLHRELANSDGTLSTLLTLSVPSQKAVSIFDDTDPEAYYDPSRPGSSTLVAGSGTTIKVIKENKSQHTMTVKVTVPAGS